jgi:hypothetical protein
MLVAKMFISIKLDFVSGWQSINDDRLSFWNYVSERAPDLNLGDLPARASRPLGEDGEEPLHFQQQRAAKLEDKFKAIFPLRLASLINAELERRTSTKQEAERATNQESERAPAVNVRLVQIEHGSLKALMELTGVSASELRDFVIFLAGTFAPQAFREAIDTRAEPIVSGSATFVSESMEKASGNRPSWSMVLTGKEALERAWVLSNISLLVPVALALSVCYVAFSAWETEMKRLHTLADEAKAERLALLKLLTDQHTKTSELLIARANAIDPGASALTELVLQLAKLNGGNAEKDQGKSPLARSVRTPPRLCAAATGCKR